MKILIKPKLSTHTIVVKPKITPSMCGNVFATPKLNPEYDATILLGPGEQLVPSINKDNDNISGCIYYAIGNPSSAFWDGWTKVTLPSLSIDPRISTWETTPAIFFSGKLHTPITCFPTRLSLL